MTTLTPDRIGGSGVPNLKPRQIATRWGSFWVIGDRTCALFLSEEAAAAAIQRYADAKETQS